VLIDLVTCGGQTSEPSSHPNFERVVFTLKLPRCAPALDESKARPFHGRLRRTKLAAAKIQRRSQDMRFDLKQSSRVAVAFVLAAVFALPQNLAAETVNHLVSPSELQQAAVKASTARQQNRDEVQRFFSSQTAQKALKSAHLNPEQVKTAVSTLDDAELAQLASRVHKAQADFAAGSLSDRDLIIILVAIAALILIIVAVR
jgi:hypothetical protein